MIHEPVYIIVNPNCQQGRGWKRWKSVREETLKLFPCAKELVTANKEELDSQVTAILNSQDQACIISAGGDGSLHQLGNILLRSGCSQKFTIGAIGLGSSNDFLKPFQSFINGIPVRINTTHPPLFQDAGKVDYTDGLNRAREKFFLVNASVGVTAEGNWHFNNPGRVLKWLKKTNISAAISYAAVSTILTYRNKPAAIHFNDQKKQANISNINILKSAYVSGTLHYKQNILPDDGRLGLNVCMNMKKLELLQTLWQLEKGRFPENEKRLSVLTNKFSLSSDQPMIFECDGETDRSASLAISVVPKAISVLAA